nr:MAG TPA: hypothetical protein [Caudoviricetes sp.]
MTDFDLYSIFTLITILFLLSNIIINSSNV